MSRLNASPQFIIELWMKMHPKSQKKHFIDLTEAEVDEVQDRIDERSTISIVHAGANAVTNILLDDLRSVVLAASLDGSENMRKYLEKPISDILNSEKDGLDEESLEDWMANYAYHRSRYKAAKRIEEEVVQPTIEATNKQGINFYL